MRAESLRMSVEVAPVLIVGAGTAGMTAALELAHHGVHSLVLDDGHELSSGSRAVTSDQTSLAVWEKYGCADALLARGVHWKTRRVWVGDDEILADAFASPWPHSLPPYINLSQYEVERRLLERVESTPHIELFWDHTLVGITQDERAVSLHVEAPDGAVQVRGQYVLACDGARSTVRKALKLPFPGRTLDDRFILADVRIEGEGVSEPTVYIDHASNPDRVVCVHPLPDQMVRIDWQVGPEGDTDQGCQPERVSARVRQLFGDVAHEVVWATHYRVQQRQLASLRAGRVLFAGDSAHVMAPFGARGMNSGVHDVENLCWKLCLVLNGRAPASLLDSYSAERGDAGRHNQDRTLATMRFVSPHTRVDRARRDAILKLFGVSDSALGRVDVGRMSEPFTYAPSALFADDEPDARWYGAPDVGARFIDAPYLRPDGARRMLRRLFGHGFVVLLFDDTPARALALQRHLPPLQGPLVTTVCAVVPGEPHAQSNDLVKLVYDTSRIVATSYGAEPGTVFLVRPDGHIAARRRRCDFDEITALLRRCHGA